MIVVNSMKTTVTSVVTVVISVMAFVSSSNKTLISVKTTVTSVVIAVISVKLCKVCEHNSHYPRLLTLFKQ